MNIDKRQFLAGSAVLAGSTMTWSVTALADGAELKASHSVSMPKPRLWCEPYPRPKPDPVFTQSEQVANIKA